MTRFCTTSKAVCALVVNGPWWSLLRSWTERGCLAVVILALETINTIIAPETRFCVIVGARTLGSGDGKVFGITFGHAGNFHGGLVPGEYRSSGRIRSAPQHLPDAGMRWGGGKLKVLGMLPIIQQPRKHRATYAYRCGRGW